jgi:hypothetical protein
LDEFPIFGVVAYCLLADICEFVDGLVVDLGEEFLGAETLVAYLLDAFEVFRKFSLVFVEVGLDLLDELIEEHLHDCEIVLELLHDLVADVVVHEQFVLFFGEGLAVDLALAQADVGLVGDHALPFGQHQDEHFCLVQRDVQLLHREAVVDLQRQVVQEHGLVSLEQEPVLYLPDCLFFVFSLLVLLCDRLVYVLFLVALIGLARVDH